jgi:hypothetical protein
VALVRDPRKLDVDRCTYVIQLWILGQRTSEQLLYVTDNATRFVNNAKGSIDGNTQVTATDYNVRREMATWTRDLK